MYPGGVTMTYRDIILKEIEQVPDPVLEEVVDFIQFLKRKVLQNTFEITLASESSLKRDWLRPEEEDAWQNL